MTQKTNNNILPEANNIYQLEIEQDYQGEKPKEPEFQVIPSIHKRKDKVCIIIFKTLLTYRFRIRIEIYSVFNDESLKDLNDDELLKLAIANCYPIYSKTFMTLAFMLEEMGYTALFMSYSQFIETAEKNFK